MATVRRVQYFYVAIPGEPDEADGMLSHLAEQGTNLLALNIVPMGPNRTQLTLFPDDPPRLQTAAKAAGLTLDGPHVALLVQGEDKMGALAGVHARLHKAGVEVYASSAIVDGRGYFGSVLYLRAEEADRAVAALKD